MSVDKPSSEARALCCKDVAACKLPAPDSRPVGATMHDQTVAPAMVRKKQPRVPHDVCAAYFRGLPPPWLHHAGEMLRAEQTRTLTMISVKSGTACPSTR